MSDRPVRQVDVAKKAKVSVTTVSLALRNSPLISNAVGDRVRKIAEEMGYCPDPVAQALRCKSSLQKSSPRFFGTVGLVMSQACATARRQIPCFSEWDEMLKACCRNSGYALDRFEVGPSEKEQRHLDRVLKARGVQGLLFYGALQEIHGWHLDWNSYAVVAYAASSHEHFVHNVVNASSNDTYDVMAQLHQLGYKRPGYFVSSPLFDFWKAGFSSAIDQMYGASDIPVIDRMVPGNTTRVFCEWVEKYQPDVVITLEEPRLQDLFSMGLRVPEDIGFIWLDVLPGQLNISGMIQPRDSAHKVMIDLLHGMLTRHEYGAPAMPMCIQLPSIWNPGATVRKQR